MRMLKLLSAAALVAGSLVTSPAPSVAQNRGQAFKEACERNIEEGRFDTLGKCRGGVAGFCRFLEDDLGYPYIGEDPDTGEVVTVTNRGQCQRAVRANIGTFFYPDD